MAAGGDGPGGHGGDGGGSTSGPPFTSKGESSYETQTALATDGQGGVVVVWLAVPADGQTFVGYAISRDGGDSWSAPAYIKSPGDRWAFDPVVAASPDGRFAVAWLGYGLDVASPDEHIYVSLLDESDTFGEPAIASDDGSSNKLNFDKPWIGFDPAGELLLTFADFSAAPTLVFARGDGVEFKRTVVATDSEFGNLASVCFDPSKDETAPLYMVHLGAGQTLVLRRSLDQGTTWPVQTAPPAAEVLFQDPTCIVSGADVAIAYATGTAPFTPGFESPADAIRVVISPNGGQTFGSPVDVAPVGLTQYLYPRIARGVGTKLEVVYYEGTDGGDATFMHASSSNGGSWTQAPIADAGSFATDLSLASWLGGYVGVAVPGATGFVSFAENTEGKTHIAFAEIAIP